jgi:hypothetical protein
MDSKPIADRLEREHPSPSLHLDSPILTEVMDILPKIDRPLAAATRPLVPVNLLNERSSEFFHRTREEDIGKPLAQWMREKGGEEAWIGALSGIKMLGDVVKANGGPFVMGKTRKLAVLPKDITNRQIASYADFVIVGFLQFFKVIEEDYYQRLVKAEPVLGELYEATKPWLERDGH